MDMSIISVLLDKAAQDSKKALNREDSALFRDELQKAISEDGVNDMTTYFLVQGIKYGSIGAYMNATRGLSPIVQCEYLEKILSSKKVANLEVPVRLGMILIFLSYNLKEKVVNDAIVGELLHWGVDLSFSTDGKRLSNLSKVFNIGFLRKMDNDTRLPDLEKYNYTDEYRGEIIKFFQESIEGLMVIKEKDVESVKIINNWINQYVNIADGKNPDSPTAVVAEKLEQSIISGTTESVQEKQEAKVQPANTVTEKKVKRPSRIELKDKSDCFKKIIDIALEVEKLEEEKKSLRNKNKTLNEKNKELESEKESISSNLAATELLCQEKQNEIDMLKADVAHRNEVIDIVKADKTESSQEFKNALAASLKSFKADFDELKSMEMTEDVGLAIVATVEDILKVLNKNGIHV